uniref:Uncharacterized protein n=1 Tax=Escherichia coli TaxID=562 RepID=A0A1W5T824_ECOLX|nr:hypothetical protein [Escherichia coli]
MGKLTLVEQALRLHKEYYGEDNFGTVVKDCDYYPKVAEIFINRKNRKFIRILISNPLLQPSFIREVALLWLKPGGLKSLCLKMVREHTGFILVKMKWFILFASFLTLSQNGVRSWHNQKYVDAS